jgi:pimeloyl-ACP methyl ester carboxylesterase
MPEAVVVTRPLARTSPVFYLHGFVSSPRSTKVEYFVRMLAQRGVDVQSPDFNEPDFRALTMTRMLDQLHARLAAGDGPATLIGSSLGGALAVLAAARFGAAVDRLVLLAPAVMFGDPDHHLLPREQIEAWKRRGEFDFVHYGYGETRQLSYAFYEDSLKYDAFGTLFTQPTLIFQGTRDSLVDSKDVERFAATRPNVTLSLLDDDHQLVASLPKIWNDVAPFLGVL